ncbi:hypothetical protein U1Q18_013796 [Sarracenia purpurea var. burkii]
MGHDNIQSSTYEAATMGTKDLPRQNHIAATNLGMGIKNQQLPDLATEEEKRPKPHQQASSRQNKMTFKINPDFNHSSNRSKAAAEVGPRWEATLLQTKAIAKEIGTQTN